MRQCVVRTWLMKLAVGCPKDQKTQSQRIFKISNVSLYDWCNPALISLLHVSSGQLLRLHRVFYNIQVVPFSCIHIWHVQLSRLCPWTFCTLLQLVACIFVSLIALVLSAWFSTAIQNHSVSFLRQPDVSQASASSRQFVEFVSRIVRGEVLSSITFVFLSHRVFEMHVSLTVPAVQNIFTLCATRSVVPPHWRLYTLWVKKHDTLLMSITSRKIGRFSRFFHWYTQNKIFHIISIV